MKPEQRTMITDTLAKYGAGLTDKDKITVNGGNVTMIKIVIKKGRIRFENSLRDSLIMSGPITPSTIESFLKEFWYMEKKQ